MNESRLRAWRGLPLWIVACLAVAGFAAGVLQVWRMPKAIVSAIDLRGQMSSSAQLVAALDDVGRDRRVKAVVLRIESPGGSVAVAQDVFDAVRRLRESGKPVVAAIGSVGASGGYYAALAADEIWAQPGSLTGSIGVIYERLDVSGLAGRLGVSREAMTAGAYKDAGSMWRKPTAAETAMMRGVLRDVYDQFTEVVRTRRGLDEAALAQVAEGRIWTGRQALARRLVDRLGSWREAARRAAELAGHSPDIPVEEFDLEGWAGKWLKPWSARAWAAAALRALALGEWTASAEPSLPAPQWIWPGWVAAG